jgi:hypothetical protein
MGPKFKWIKDDLVYKAEVESGGSTENVAIIDAYAQWLLGWGREFDYSSQLAKEDPVDFSFVDRIQSLTGASNPGRVTSHLSTAGLPDAADYFVAPLPIRNRSLFKGALSVDAAHIPDPRLASDKIIVVGLIDDAINITHERLRDADGKSRVDYAWIQDADAPTDQSYVPIGRVWSAQQITQAINDFGGAEDRLFKELGLVGDPSQTYRQSSLNLRTSHGSFVADKAAGYDPFDPDALNRRVVAVQLPALASKDTSGATLIAPARMAAKFIFDRALAMSESLGVAVPVVLNFSYGFSSGPRNGRQILERALRALALKYRLDTAKFLPGTAAFGAPVCRLVPAGNSPLTGGHATSRGDNTLDMCLRLQPEDRTASFVEVWLPQNAQTLSLSVEAPDGTSGNFAYDLSAQSRAETLGSDEINLATIGDAYILVAKNSAGADASKKPICRISSDIPELQYQTATTSGHLYHRLLLAFAPTQTQNPNRPSAPHGLWKIGVVADANIHNIQAWIQRDEALPGYSNLGRQAYFEDDTYEAHRFDALGDIAVADAPAAPGYISRDGTLSGLATNHPLVGEGDLPDAFLDCIVVGAGRWDIGGASVCSAAGQTGLPGLAAITAPNVIAVADSSRVLTGTLAAGSRSGGSRVSMNGTSAAVPLISRWIADQLASKSASERVNFDVIAELQSAVGTEGFTAPKRADTDRPELASQPQVRAERLAQGGGFYSGHTGNAGISRGMVRKTG